MTSILRKIIGAILKPIFMLLYHLILNHFKQDFDGPPVFMITELTGGEDAWLGKKQRHANLGNTHPWNRYFNRLLDTKPDTLADIERFLKGCKYRSDQETRSQEDFWEPPDQFEKRRSGDCEDHAIWAWRQLYDLGFRSRLVLGTCFDRGHAWVHLFVNGRCYLLEATQKHAMLPRGDHYKANWSVENVGKKKFEFFAHFN